MTLTRYHVRQTIAGFFEIATEDARRLLPSRYSPLEVHYGRSVLVVNVYEFGESPVGEYSEVVYGVMTLPRVVGGVVPQGSVYPFQVATTTARAREHAMERWHLPHWPDDIEVELREVGEGIRGAARVDGVEVMALHVTPRQWTHEPRIYQSFMHDARGSFMAQIHYDGEISEHEEETGRLTFDPSHPFNASIADADLDARAFREVSQRGVQTFEPLERVD